MLRDLKCKAFASVSGRVGSQFSNAAVVKKGGSEGIESYVHRLSDTFCGSKKAWTTGKGDKGFLHSFLTAKAACEKATDRHARDKGRCTAKEKAYYAKRAECDRLQSSMDTASCAWAVQVKDACEEYSSCYLSTGHAYKRMEAVVKKSEKERKAEWRGLKRMDCLIAAFSDGKVTAGEVDACKAKKHSTGALDIRYPRLPTMGTCSVPDSYPATATYKRAEFAPLPALAKGNAEAHVCSGVAEISTTPASGSPRECKCTRVALNGPYSAGPMVKCEKCRDVRRSNDQSSCPEGTKIFSPRNKDDWRTFILSATPLRAPNWIIDVTRPQNGCGGCTKVPMNSDESRQRSWRTSDGSAWWLRSTRYSEPNGDYDANCYLDLWKPPTSPSRVTFNDDRCSYHANSYYCQPQYINTKPKKGSPKSCHCSKVELAGSYSAGYLLKCLGCLDARRSNDKNSCPEGTKLFAPASRADWKTFLGSASRLKDPNWIVDVTRPQNGCGGCTRASMNSDTASQATWRTSDGASWWLRSTKYNEPNGDYKANCFMDLWRIPVSENGIQFNDHNCNYHSRSYYCQPKKKRG